jgi:hypothetical protein
MKLPHGERANVGDKLEQYVLNAAHRQGKHKARVFESVLGITIQNGHVLRDAILHAAANSNEAEARGHRGFGQCYTLRFSVKTQFGSGVVMTAWIVRDGEDFPRLTTCYIV